MPGLGYWPLPTRHGERVCAECGATFTALAPGQKYCTVAHEVQARNRRHGAEKRARRKREKVCLQAK